MIGQNLFVEVKIFHCNGRLIGKGPKQGFIVLVKGSTFFVDDLDNPEGLSL